MLPRLQQCAPVCVGMQLWKSELSPEGASMPVFVARLRQPGTAGVGSELRLLRASMPRTSFRRHEVKQAARAQESWSSPWRWSHQT